MLTISDLGKKLKKEYPNKFRNLTDEQVGRAAKRAAEAKGLDDFNEYEEVNLFVLNKNNAQLETTKQQVEDLAVSLDKFEQIEDDLTTKIHHLWNKHDPNMGNVVAWWRKRKIEGQNRFIATATEQMKALIEQADLMAEQVVKGMRRGMELELFYQENQFAIAQLTTNTELMKAAAAQKLTPGAYDKVRTEEELSKIRIREHEQKTQIDLDRKLQEKQEAVRLALISKHLSDIQKISLVQEQIDLVYKQINDIESGLIVSSNNTQLSNTVKQLMVKDRMDIIKTLQELRSARQQRLLETDNGGELRGNDKTPLLR